MLTSFNQDFSGTNVFVTSDESPYVFYVRSHKWYSKMNNSFLFLLYYKYNISKYTFLSNTFAKKVSNLK
jgi:hypothetical protein